MALKNTNNIDISIVIVNYKMNAVLKECLRAVFMEDSDINLEVIVVDNETDGSLRRDIPEYINKVRLIENSDNAGFARACNQGTEVSTGRYVLYLNPDTEICAETLKKLMNFMDENPSAGIVGPLTRNTDGSIEPSVYNFPSVWHTLVDVLYLGNITPAIQGYERKNYQSLTEIESVEVICGACLMTRRELIDKYGGFDNDFWMYGEDVELCYRYKKAGYKSVYLKNCEFIHKRGSKHTQENTVVDMSKVAYWHYRWLFLFHQKHSGFITRFIIRRLLYMNIIAKYLPRKKKLVSGKNTSNDNIQRINAFERLLEEYYGKKY